MKQAFLPGHRSRVTSLEVETGGRYRSECTPIGGDCIVTANEECDDGVNVGGYEQCAPGCVLGPSCGDGVVQAGEDCDDGNRVDNDACGSACRVLVLL